MYKHILVPLENSDTDQAILKHIRDLARWAKARLTLLHVADGLIARNQDRFAESEEIRQDRAYLQKIEAELQAEGFEVRAVLDCGDPAKQILATADDEGIDLIAMSTHGHRFFSDLVLGSVAAEVRHRARVPVLLVRAMHESE